MQITSVHTLVTCKIPLPVLIAVCKWYSDKDPVALAASLTTNDKVPSVLNNNQILIRVKESMPRFQEYFPSTCIFQRQGNQITIHLKSPYVTLQVTLQDEYKKSLVVWPLMVSFNKRRFEEITRSSGEGAQ